MWVLPAPSLLWAACATPSLPACAPITEVTGCKSRHQSAQDFLPNTAKPAPTPSSAPQSFPSTAHQHNLLSPRRETGWGIGILAHSNRSGSTSTGIVGEGGRYVWEKREAAPALLRGHVLCLWLPAFAPCSIPHGAHTAGSSGGGRASQGFIVGSLVHPLDTTCAFDHQEANDLLWNAPQRRETGNGYTGTGTAAAAGAQESSAQGEHHRRETQRGQQLSPHQGT